MKKTSALFTLLLVFSISLLQAQTYDYPLYPRLDVSYEHMEGQIDISPLGEIRGDISYVIRFNVEKSDSIQLHAVRMQVENVLLDERTMDFEIHNDSLIVYLDDTFARSQLANLRVVYSSAPLFGVLRTYRGTIFSSQLPLSKRHWLPIADYPSTQVSYDLTFTHPAGKSLVMSGSLFSNTVESVDTEVTQYRSVTRRPVNSLFFAISDFETTNKVLNSKNIRLHVEQPNRVEINPDELTALADKTIQRMEDLTGSEYPYRNLDLIAVHDLMWEQRTFGSGVILIDVNSNIEQQIIYGVMGQWAGVLLREMQWQEADAIQLLHGYLGNQLGLESFREDTLQPWNSLYNKISAENIDRYKYHLASNNLIGQYVRASKEALFDETRYPIIWEDFKRTVYRETGRMINDKPVFEEPVVERVSAFRYDVGMNIDEGANQATIRFTADGPAIDELVTIQVTQYTFTESVSSELTFTGAQDEIIISLKSGLENIELTVLNRDDIELDVEKPFMYWIYQLQNSESENQRLKAAVGLRQYADNPDLQLAILDMIRNESSAAVKAEILETLRMVTEGASGTAQLFVERVGQDQSLEVRATALKALGAYPGNDSVIRTLQSIIQSADIEELKIHAINSLAEVTETDQFASMVESLTVQESVLMQVPILLKALADKGEQEQAVQLSDTFLSAEFPYDVRVGALNLILEFDKSREGWQNRLEDLLTDKDPRIRYRSVSGLEYLSADEQNRLIEVRLLEEYDERVASALRNI